MKKNYLFGVDVGGTTVKLGLFDVEGNLLDKWEIPTRKEDNGSHILEDVADSIKAKMQEKGMDHDEVLGTGIGTPGPVNDEGVVLKAVNLGWNVFNVSKTLSELLDMPVKAGNDANVAALGEMWKGGGQGYKNLVAVTLGTGVGGGIILNGKILTGSNGSAGEIGHVHVQDDEPEACGCGNHGCLEMYTSATGIVRLTKRRLAQDDMPSTLRQGEISAKTVFDAVKAGDALAIEVAKVFGEYLGKALASIAGVIDPEVFVIGGGVCKAGEVLFDYICPVYEKNAFHACRGVKFALATLGNDAGIYGAARMMLD